MKINLHELQPCDEDLKGMRESCGVSDEWVYKDVPRSSERAWNATLETIGEKNFKLLIYSRVPHETENYIYRGQMLISPEGVENMRKYVKKVYKDNA